MARERMLDTLCVKREIQKLKNDRAELILRVKETWPGLVSRTDSIESLHQEAFDHIDKKIEVRERLLRIRKLKNN